MKDSAEYIFNCNSGDLIRIGHDISFIIGNQFFRGHRCDNTARFVISAPRHISIDRPNSKTR